MSKPTLKDKDFSTLMKKSKLELPFSDFETNVMQRIEAESRQKGMYAKGIQLSALFFLLGTGFGLIAQNMVKSSDAIFGLPAQQVLLTFQIIYIVIVLTQLENILQLVAKLRR